MTTITLNGGSDDLIEFCIDNGPADEINIYPKQTAAWRVDLVAPDGEAMRVYALHDGCWHFSVGQVDEGMPFPAWPVTFTQARDVFYSVAITVDAPEGTVMKNQTTL